MLRVFRKFHDLSKNSILFKELAKCVDDSHLGSRRDRSPRDCDHDYDYDHDYDHGCDRDEPGGDDHDGDGRDDAHDHDRLDP